MATPLLTELHTADFPSVYRRFAEVVGARNWTHRITQMKASIRHNRFLEAYLHRENEIAFGLDRCGDLIKRYGGLPNEILGNRVLYTAISFAAQSLSMMEIATPVEADRFRKRVAGALQNPNDMRALRLELAVATHFTRGGHKLKWPEMVGGGTFDLLVTDIGGGLEVECKSVSDDKGRNIHRREALEFHHLVFGELTHVRKTLTVGMSVVLTVPSCLPTQHADRQALAKRIRQQITIGKSVQLEDGSDIRIAEFDLIRLGNIANDRHAEVIRKVIQDVTGTQNREGMLMSADRGGALAFVTQSAVDDDLMDATFKTLSRAAKRQLSGKKSALLIAGFDGLDAEQLMSIAQQDHESDRPPTALAIKVSRFLSADYRDHVAGVVFLSRSALRPATDSVIDSGGAAYYFPKRESPFWHDHFDGLFQLRNVPDPRPFVLDIAPDLLEQS